MLEKYKDDKPHYEKLLSHGEPIVIYMHGNSGTRANSHRVELYGLLQNINCHVIAVDYRSMLIKLFSIWFKTIIFIKGYADSTDVEISEHGVVTDVMEMFKWVYKRANGTQIFGWGHSLGTG